MKTVKSICLAVLAAVLLLTCSCMLTPAATEGTVRRVGYFETDPDTHKPLIDYDMSEKTLSAADVKTISEIFRKYKLKREVFDLACTHDLTIGNTKYRYEDTEGYVECSGRSFFLSAEDNKIIKNITDRYSLKNGTLSQYDPEKCRASYADLIVAKAVYPVSPHYPDGTVTDKEAEEWGEFREKRMNAASAIDSSALGSFVKKTVREYLTSDDGGNRVYSPVSLEIALSMLAEITDGQTRAQILSLLGADSIEDARKQAVSIWDAAYREDGIGTTVLADSLWLNDGLMYKKPVLDILADSYRSSSFSGKPGIDEYDNALRGWLTEQTRGLLDTSEVKLDPRTVIALAQTVYYKVSWEDVFSKSDTGKRVFEGTTGRVSVDFMNQEIGNGTVYYGDGWQATRLKTADGGAMWLILPDKGRTTADIIASDGMFDLISGNKNGTETKRAKVRLSVPKFDVSSQTDLIQGLKNLGVTDAFGACADFSPLTDTPNVTVSGAVQEARVMIDEDGCTGAAYTLIVANATGLPVEEKETIDFILDRQFVFAVISDNGIPLFVGAVNDLTS